MFSLPNIDQLVSRWRAVLFGQGDPTPGIEEAEQSIEQRMARVRDRMAQGGYKKLPLEELEQLADDIAKIIAFVEEALVTLGLAAENAKVDFSIRRLRYLNTRLGNIREENQRLRSQVV